MWHCSRKRKRLFSKTQFEIAWTAAITREIGALVPLVSLEPTWAAVLLAILMLTKLLPEIKSTLRGAVPNC